MPRYFFTIRGRDQVKDDHQGTNLPDFAAFLMPSAKSESKCPKLSISGCLRYNARFVLASLGQNGPGDARQFVGQRSCQNVVM